MRQPRRFVLLPTLIVITAALVAVPATQAAATTSTPDEAATAINNGNTVAGYADGAAARWSPSGQLTQLASLPGAKFSYGEGINSWGEVVGGSDLAATRWSPSGQITALPDLTPAYGAPHSRAQGVNDAGVVVGISYVDPTTAHAVRWSASGTITDLGGLPGFASSEANAVNNAGIVVGDSTDPTLGTSAVRWDAKGRPTELPSPFGSQRNATEAFGINNQGDVVGVSFEVSTDSYQAIEWDPSGHLHILASAYPLPSAQAINNHGVVVGETQPKPTDSVPVTWPSRDGRLTMLPIPAGTPYNYYPNAINDHGVIVGQGNEVGLVDSTVAVRWDPNGHMTVLAGP